MRGLHLETKRLQSGNFQVRFELKYPEGFTKSGYLLAGPGITLKEAVLEIKRSVESDNINLSFKKPAGNKKLGVYMLN